MDMVALQEEGQDAEVESVPIVRQPFETHPAVFVIPKHGLPHKAFLVDAERYFLALLRYIHRNPLEARLAERAEDFVWSSDRFYRQGRAPDWFDLDRGYFLMGARRGSEARGYRELMGEEDPERVKFGVRSSLGSDL